MFINDYLPLEQLLKWMDRLNPELEKRYRIRATLIPRWKNFFMFQVDRFDRYPEMITHGSTHICNVLALAAEFVVPILNQWIKTRQIQNNPPPINGEELFLLVAAIFLHDIGMADVAEVSPRPDEVRRRHSVLSGEIIRGRYRRGHSRWNLLPSFESGEEVDVLAEICIHHQSRAPLAFKDKKKGNTAHTLEEECELNEYLHRFNGRKIDIFMITALLRILDACDVQYSRAGSVFITSVRLRNNRRLREECGKRLPDCKNDLKSFYLHYDRYLKEQEEKHFPKHSVIQKVWIIRDEVVYKPITRYERNLLAGVLPAAAIDPEPFLRKFEEEINAELAVCNAYLEGRGLAIKGIRRFSEETDPPHIADLASYSRKWYAIPKLNIPYMERKNFEGGFAAYLSKGKTRVNLMLFVGAKGIGKTCLAKKLATDLATRKRVCFVSLKPYKNRDSEETLKSIVRQITYFLAAWGDFLFYNKLRMEMDMEEEQWEILWNQINRNDIIFILDDFNKLPAHSTNSPLVRFFHRFFKVVSHGKAKMLIFSQKVPALLSDDFPWEMIQIPQFEPAETDQISQSATFVGFGPDQWPEGHQIVREVIRKNPGLPIALDFIRGELEYLSPNTPNADSFLKTALKNRLRNHIQTVYGQLKAEGREVLDFLEFIQKRPEGFKADWSNLAVESGMDIETAKKCWTVLNCRNLITPEKGSMDSYCLDPRWRTAPESLPVRTGESWEVLPNAK